MKFLKYFLILALLFATVFITCTKLDSLDDSKVALAGMQVSAPGLIAPAQGAPITTESSDPIFQLMATGLQLAAPCPWQEVYMQPYHIVRTDHVIAKTGLPSIDWVTINNELVTEYYKVYQQKILLGTEADFKKYTGSEDPYKFVLQPGKKISRGWEYTIVMYNSYVLGVAYLQIPGTDSYQVSFVKFCKWK